VIVCSASRRIELSNDRMKVRPAKIEGDVREVGVAALGVREGPTMTAAAAAAAADAVPTI
jgi:hypothetical protein